jgi:hypothetical protein
MIMTGNDPLTLLLIILLLLFGNGIKTDQVVITLH